jgi:hypothetical protein
MIEKDFIKSYSDKRDHGKEIAKLDSDIETTDNFEPTFTEICPVCKHYSEDIHDDKCPCLHCSIYYD